MTTWANTETGELVEGPCPYCAGTVEECDAIVSRVEKNRHADILARAKAEKALERDVVAKRDGADWQRIVTHWKETFPQIKATSLSIRSNRATHTFIRIERGCSVDDVLAAIDGAKEWPYVVFGKRVRTGSRSDLGIDIEDIVSIKHDRNFDFLLSEGYALRG